MHYLVRDYEALRWFSVLMWPREREPMKMVSSGDEVLVMEKGRS